MTSTKNPFLYHVKKIKKDDEIKMIKEIPRFMEISNKFSTCERCKNEMTTVYQSEFFPFEIDGEKTGIHVKNVPMQKCESCDEEYSSFRISLAIEKLIDREVFYMLNNRERDNIPTEVDFSHFVKE